MKDEEYLEIATTLHLEKFTEGAVRVRVESSNGEAIDEVFAGEAAANIGNEFSAFCAMLAKAVASVRTIN
ncbi:MAG: hypothetical protein QOK29_562 [Rhodospirillaceae bacterium]|jgi:hypothetical protein|nr:hypothetical protein [Rhodospirillaceae bacterium]